MSNEHASQQAQVWYRSLIEELDPDNNRTDLERVAEDLTLPGHADRALVCILVWA
jgi:hypothetical protein